MFEHHKSTLLPRSAFILRMLRSAAYGLFIVAAVITCGTLGFHYIEQISWIDAFLEAAMFYGGLGTEFIIETWWGKFFAAVYAILCPFALVTTVTIILLPLLHRFMHRFHIDSENMRGRK